MNEPSAVLLFDDELHIVSVLPFGRSLEESERLREIIAAMMGNLQYQLVTGPPIYVDLRKQQI